MLNPGNTYSFTNQTDVIRFLNDTETRFRVNRWKCEGVHLWPVIRLRLAEHLLGYVRYGGKKGLKTTISKSSAGKGLLHKMAKNLAKAWYTAYYMLWQRNLPKNTDILFVGAPHYRQEVDGVEKNKFFDPLIEKYGIEHFCWLDVGPPANNPSWPEKGLDFEKGASWFMKYRSMLRSLKLAPRRPNLELTGYEDFRGFLQTIEAATGFAEEYTSDKLAKVVMEWHDYYLLFKRMLLSLKPSRVILLCYFDLPRMALCAAANRMDIPVIEIQHGTVDIIYYQGWHNLPEKGYEMLPNGYWCWNSYSEETFAWASKHPNYRVFTGGNPWVDYWDGKTIGEDHTEQIILYTLQDLPPDKAFPPALLNAIKKTTENWYIRLHPNFMHFKEDIERLLNEHNVIDKVNFDDANRLPLALLLKQTTIHVTASSSSAMEASEFGVKTLFLDKISKEWFPALYRQYFCKYINPDSNVFDQQFYEFYTEVQSGSTEILETVLDHKSINGCLNITSL